MALSDYSRWQQKRLTLGWVRWDAALHPSSCPLCLKPFEAFGRGNGYAVWDHCHRCEDHAVAPGSFRGYICSLCNTAEGQRHRKVAGRGIMHLLRDKKWQKRLQAYLDAHICPPYDPILSRSRLEETAAST